MIDISTERIRRTRWPCYAACLWSVLFGALHLYWALGGTAGFDQFSLPENKILAITRDPNYVRMTWIVGLMCLFSAAVALAPIQPWSRHLPRWLLLTALWIACGLFLVRGFGNLIQTALVTSGVINFEPLAGKHAQAWYQWLVMDTVIFSPWFILGGFAFGATARSLRRWK
jgi:hypothetical protein